MTYFQSEPNKDDAAIDTDLCVWIDPTKETFKVKITLDEKELASDSQLLPIELRSLRFNNGQSGYLESKLIYVLDRFAHRYQLKCKVGQSFIDVDWDPDEKIKARIGYRWTPEGVIKESFIDTDQDPNQSCRVVSTKFCVNLEEKLLCRAILDEQEDDVPFGTSLSFKDFNKLGLSEQGGIWIDEKKSLNKPEPLNLLDADHHVYIEEDESADPPTLSISYRQQVAGVIIDSTKDIFEALESIQFLYEPLKRSNRMTHLKRAVLMLLSLKTREERDRVIQEMIKEPLFSTSTIKQVAKRYLVEVFDKVVLKKRELVIATSTGFKKIALESSKAGLGLGIPYLLFDAPLDRAFSSFGANFDKELVLKNLPVLFNMYQTNQITLFFEGKPVTPVEMDLIVKSEQKDRLEWFDLHPEIQVQGQSIEGALKEILKRPYFETPTQIQVPTLESFNTLNFFEAWWQQYEKNINESHHSHVPTIQKLRVLELLSLKQKGIQVQLSESENQLLDQLSNIKKIPGVPKPKSFKGKLWDFQEVGYHWLCFLYQYGFGGCLADDMGLGKTIQTICFLTAIHEGVVHHPQCAEGARTLIVVPPSLIYNWLSEFQTFSPHLNVMVYDRSEACKEAEVVITSYDLVRRDTEELSLQKFDILICDEAQKVKNLNTQRTKAIRQLKATFRLTLSGTPIENHLSDFYSIMDLSVPGLLESYSVFNARVKGGEHRFFIDKTKPFILRRKKEEVLSSLPPKVESDIYLDLSPEQKLFYIQTISQVRKDVRKAFKDKPAQQAGIMALTALLRLRQICISPALIDPEYDKPSPKLSFLMERLDELMSEGHSSLVFSQFTKSLDIIEVELKARKFKYWRMDGKTTPAKRQKIVQDFQKETEPAILLMSLKVGGVGLNLTRASYVFHVDPWWNPAVENQATDRVHRIGQTQKVLVTRLMMRHSIEEKMMALKEKKKALYASILENHEQQARSGLSWEDFEMLLS